MMDPSGSRHDSDHRDHRRYDPYGLQHAEQGSSELIPAATVIVLRDAPDGIETLMLHKNVVQPFPILLKKLLVDRRSANRLD